MNFFPGQIIRGQYKLIREIGQGGFAVAYEAIDQYRQKTVAIKLLLSSATQEEKETFQQEIRIHMKLHHDHIVELLDFNLVIDPVFLVAVYAENGTLERRTQGKVLTVTEVVTYAKPIAKALQYLHGQGIVHRDINPANILLDRKGTLLLSDFGNALPQHMTPKQVVGAPDYMSPEQINKKPAEPASDQYSLAVVMYEWLCGTVPFSGNTLADVLHGHLHNPPAPMPRVPSQITQVIFKALSKGPGDRYPSITAFMDALEQAARQATTAAANPPPPWVPPQPSPLITKHQVVRFGLGCLVCLIFISSAGSGLYYVVGWIANPNKDSRHIEQLAHQKQVTPLTPIPTIPTPMTTEPPPTPTTKTYQLFVFANQGPPGLDTGIDVYPYNHLTITAQGSASHGSEGDCSGNPTNPDGVSIVNGSPCTFKDPSAVDPSSPLGMLLFQLEDQTGNWYSSHVWSGIGSSYANTLFVNGGDRVRLFLIYNDVPGSYEDNTGIYQITVTVTQ